MKKRPTNGKKHAPNDLVQMIFFVGQSKTRHWQMKYSTLRKLGWTLGLGLVAFLALATSFIQMVGEHKQYRHAFHETKTQLFAMQNSKTDLLANAYQTQDQVFHEVETQEKTQDPDDPKSLESILEEFKTKFSIQTPQIEASKFSLTVREGSQLTASLVLKNKQKKRVRIGNLWVMAIYESSPGEFEWLCLPGSCKINKKTFRPHMMSETHLYHIRNYAKPNLEAKFPFTIDKSKLRAAIAVGVSGQGKVSFLKMLDLRAKKGPQV